MGKTLRFLGWLAALLLAVGCASAAVVGLGGGASDKLDILNQFTPFWFVGAALACAVALPLSRGQPRWLVLAPAIVALLIGGVRIAPEVVGRLTPGAPAEGERLKLVHFNVYFDNSAPAQSVDWILAQDADVVVIVEGEGLPRDQALRLRARYPYCNGCPDRGYWSNMILAKRPALAQGRFERPTPDTNFPILGGWSRFAGPGGDFTVIGVHATWPWMRGGRQQREAMAEFIGRNPTDRVILSGDFNMTPWSSALRKFDRSLGGLHRRTHGQGSWPAQSYYRIPMLPITPAPFLAIDQVYAGQGWRTVSVKRGPRLGSDHYPMVVELAAAPKR